ncbi:MAG: hypothetical protein D6744_00830, partial [Planctomycetota bacterium]
MECWELCAALLERRFPGMRERRARLQAAGAVLDRAFQLGGDARYCLDLAVRFSIIGTLALSDEEIKLIDAEDPAAADAMRTHTRLGARLLHKTFPDYPDAIEAVWYQYERFDGGGPFGLVGDEIPPIAQINSLAHFLE